MKAHSPLSLRLFVLESPLPALAFYIGSVVRQAVPFGETLTQASAHPPLRAYLMVSASWMVSLTLQGAYEPERVLRWYQEVLRIAAAAVMATVLLAGQLYLTRTELSRFQFFYAAVATVIGLLLVRWSSRTWYRLAGFNSRRGTVRILMVGAGCLGHQAAAILRNYARWSYQLVGFVDDDPVSETDDAQAGDGVPWLGVIDKLEDVVTNEKIDDVWIALPTPSYDRTQEIVERLADLPVRVHIIPDYFSLALVRARPANFGGLPVIALRDPVILGAARLTKRLFDIVAGAVALLLTGPIFAVLAVLIHLDSAGPVFFKQERVGENGRVFRMFKFRTMVLGAERKEQEFQKAETLTVVNHKQLTDTRVTRIGRCLRRWSLDELPQLFNVIRGDMSLVGPRPELPWLVARYSPWQRRRLAVPQGMTGWWQVRGRGDKPMHLHTDEDLYYVYHYSLWLDVKIIAKTFKAVWQGRGAF